MQTKLKRLAGALILALSSPVTVSASTVFDNTSNGYVNDGNNWYQVITTSQWIATRFSVDPGIDYTLDKITVRLNTPGSTPIFNGFLDMSIHADNGTEDSNAIGALLGNLTNFGLIYPKNPGESLSFDFMPTATNILLEKGEDYWVRLAPNTILPATAGWDMLNVSNVAGAVLTHTGTGTNYYNTRSMPLIVEGTAAISAVPIPGAVWLMGSALIGFVGWGRRTVVA